MISIVSSNNNRCRSKVERNVVIVVIEAMVVIEEIGAVLK